MYDLVALQQASRQVSNISLQEPVEPMIRARGVAPGLKHLAFFERLADEPEDTPVHRATIAGVLTLRLIDHWILAGSVMVEPESTSVKSVRQAIMSIVANDPQREVLLGVVNTMQTLREVDVQPILPRLLAYAQILEKRAEFALAADTYGSVARLGDPEHDHDILIDANMRLGFCERNLGELDVAERAYARAGSLSKQRGELSGALRSEIGLAALQLMRGNLPAADDLLRSVAERADHHGLREEHASALHTRSVVAQRRGDLDRAVCFAHDALSRTTAPTERDRIFGDLGAYFIVMRRYGAARDALTILEATATTEEVRTNALINLLALAARSGDRELFVRCRGALKGREMTTEGQVNLLIESARGLRRFGEADEGQQLLRDARDIARVHSLNRSLFEAESLLQSVEVGVEETTSRETLSPSEDPAAHVVRDLRLMAAALPD